MGFDRNAAAALVLPWTPIGRRGKTSIGAFHTDRDRDLYGNVTKLKVGGS